MASDDTKRPGEYADHRHLVDDPERRKAFLLQVRGTVEGLRGAYRAHVLGALGAVAFLALARPGGWLGEQRMLLIGLLLAIDLVGLAGLRTVASTPARYVLPVALLDLGAFALALGMALAHGGMVLPWLLLLAFPAMLLIYLRDARAIAPVLAEHAAWRAAGGAAPRDEGS